VVYNKWKTEKFLYELMCSLLYYTSFIKENKFLLGLRIYCLEERILEYPICECGKRITKIWNHLKFNKYCSQSCANKYTNPLKENVYGKEMSEKIWGTRRKNGNGKLSDDHKTKLSLIHKSKETKEKMKNSCLNKYGFENPGVLGAYYSKSAEKYIRNFILENNIDEKRCYFKNGGKNNKEYFQMIFNKEKNRYVYFSYDLIVLDENDNIKLVLEYNGPWHYTKEEIHKDPNGPATPYKTNKLTKKDTYERDKAKIESYQV